MEPLDLSRGGGGLQRIDFPELDIAAEIFYADFALHLGSGFAQPHDAELRLGSLIAEIDDVAGFKFRVDALQRGATAANGTQAGGLLEGPGVGVSALNFNW